MDDDKISKKEKQALRREKTMVRQVKQSDFINELMTNFEDRPEEACSFLLCYTPF
jgi:U3 small nucleolar ribonucleoprotein protein LCP5